jgi:hypothetical protein
VLFKAYDLLSAQEAQPLNYTWPVAVAILSVPFLKQSIARVSIAAILVSFFGVIATRGDILGFRFTDPTGVALAVGIALIWATYWLANVCDDRDYVLKLFLSFSFGLVFVTIAALVLTGRSVGDLRGVGWRVRDGRDFRAMDARPVPLQNGSTGEQSYLPLTFPVSRTHQRNRRRDDPAFVDSWSRVHRRGNRYPPVRSCCAGAKLTWYHSRHYDNFNDISSWNDRRRDDGLSPLTGLLPQPEH